VFNIGPLELIVVLIIALIVLGPHRLPDAARAMGRGIREFRGALNMEHDDEDDYTAPPPPAQTEALPAPEHTGAADKPAEPAATPAAEPAKPPGTPAAEPAKPAAAKDQPAAAKSQAPSSPS